MKEKHTMIHRKEKSIIDGRQIIFFSIAIIIFILDRISKYIAYKYLANIEIIPDFLSLTLITNTGAGFGIFKDKIFILMFISLIFIFLILVKYKQILEYKYYWCISLILGGALGNLYDRLFYSYVIDFINFHFWPVFNAADTAISIGAIYIMICFIKEKA